jgi:hypothetical protein
MIKTEGSWFKDEAGRLLMLRGVNLGGSSKVPFTPDGATHIRERFFDHRQVSFVGRPFPLEEADEHFDRLNAWGMTFLRLLVTWEAIEHAGPGIYDQEYLDYIRAVVQKAAQHDIMLLIDPHQDVWSRFTGGDGAPGWTLEAVGFEMRNFHQTGAAIVHATHSDPFPRMIWPTNGGKLAAATMFTLFFGGSNFAPKTKLGDEPIQDYLQRHYLEAIQQVAQRLRDLPNVIGYGTMNEPLPGYIGWRDLHEPGGILLMGECPSPFQSMLLGEGFPQEIGVCQVTHLGLRRTRTRLLNSEQCRAWRGGSGCIWRQHGVWDLDSTGKPHLLKPDYFTTAGGKPVNFAYDYYRPFANRFARAVRKVHPDTLIFIEAEPESVPPYWEETDAEGIVFAPHWYDGILLMTKTYSPFLGYDFHTKKIVIGCHSVEQSFSQQLEVYKDSANERLGGAPVLLTEFGVPFDINRKKSYRTGDYRIQIKALDRSFRAVEANLLSCILWNYTPDNNNKIGDRWNDEDLSIFSRDQQTNPEDVHSGGRALEAAVRPYPMATAGEPLQLSFDIRKGAFEYEFRHDPEISAPTVVFLPRLHYPDGYLVEISDGEYQVEAEKQQLLYYHNSERSVHKLQITRSPGSQT